MTTTEQPKRAPSAYWLWQNDNREIIKKDLNTTKFGDVAKEASVRWAALPEDQKAVYNKKAEEAKAEFKTATAGVVVKRQKKGGKEKDPNAPKMPAGGAYGVYLADNREEIKKSLPAGHAITEVTKKAGELWKALAEDEKKPYQARYETKMEEYKVAKAEFEAKTGNKVDEDEEEETSPKKDEQKASASEVKKAAAKEPKEVKKRAAPVDAKEAPAKRGKKAAGASEEPTLSATVLEQATKLGFADELKNLAKRADVVAAGKSDEELLAALRSSGGLVNPARRALLGA